MYKKRFRPEKLKDTTLKVYEIIIVCYKWSIFSLRAALWKSSSEADAR